MGKKILGLLLTGLFITTAHAQLPLETPGASGIVQSEVVLETVDIRGPDGLTLCSFVVGTGVYTRGQDYAQSNCQDYVQAVSAARPYSLFCWMSDPCSSQQQQRQGQTRVAPTPTPEQGQGGG